MTIYCLIVCRTVICRIYILIIISFVIVFPSQSFCCSFFLPRPPLGTWYRLQDFDNGYFEKFGSLLQRKIQDVDQNIAAPAFEIASKQVTDSVSLRTIEEAENDSGTETLHDTDSEPDDQQSKQEDLIEECTGLNVSIYNSSCVHLHTLTTFFCFYFPLLSRLVFK